MSAGPMVMRGGRTLLVTADDFGLSPAVDEGILRAHREGPVGSTSLMTNLPGLAEASARLRDAPRLAVGVHLNLTCGRPLLPPATVPTLVDGNGRFLSLPRLALRLACGGVRRTDVEREWSAQLAAGSRLGWRFSFLSSHRHVHMHPRLWQAARSLARRYRIAALRVSAFPLRLTPRSVKAWTLGPLAAWARRTAAREGFLHNGEILELPTGTRRPLAVLRRRLRALPAGVHELVCHPGYVDAPLLERDPYTDGRTAELDLLASDALAAFLAEEELTLASWRELESDRRMGPPARRPTERRRRRTAS